MQNRIKSRKIKPAFLTSTHAKITLEGEEKEKIKEQLKREEGINQGRYL
jgi:CDGSH-type Zn-finger protein